MLALGSGPLVVAIFFWSRLEAVNFWGENEPAANGASEGVFGETFEYAGVGNIFDIDLGSTVNSPALDLVVDIAGALDALGAGVVNGTFGRTRLHL